jgi:hypothetical protein
VITSSIEENARLAKSSSKSDSQSSAIAIADAVLQLLANFL